MILAAFCCFMASATVGAAEAATDVSTEQETEAKEDLPAVLEELKVGDLVLSNATQEKAAQLFVKEAAEDAWGDDLLAKDAPAFSLKEKQAYDLKLCDEKGAALLFYNLVPDEMKEICLAAADGKTYVIYKDAKSGETVNRKDYALDAYESPKVLYSTVGLNVRELPNTDAKILGGLTVGQEAVAYGEANDWYLIRKENGYGYVSGKFMTESKEEADRLAAEAAERARAEAAAQAAAYANQQQSYTSSGSGKKPSKKPQSERYEVSREEVPSCDDPNHGTIYITYSDGSVAVSEY